VARRSKSGFALPPRGEAITSLASFRPALPSCIVIKASANHLLRRSRGTVSRFDSLGSSSDSRTYAEERA
jgi:hypothetical protein